MEAGHSLLYLIVIIAAAKLGGEISERIRLPATLGELLVGVLLSFTSIRAAADDSAILFVASIGIILLLFGIGLESGLDDFIRVGRSASLVAIIGVVVPLVTGYVVSLALLGDYRQALFLGATLTATSVGITARVLSDLGHMGSIEAKIIIGAAVIDDILGLLVLSTVLQIVSTGTLEPSIIARSAGIAIVFLVGAVWIGIRFAGIFVPIARSLRTHGVLVSFSFLFCITLAYMAQLLGLAEIIGAFAAGLALETTDDSVKIQRKIKPLEDIFLPVFFVVVGLQVSFAGLNPATAGGRQAIILGVVLLVLAIVGKLISGLGVLKPGANKLAIGVGMVPRGEVGLIFASVGLREGIISGSVYAAVIFVVFISTLITPTWLSHVFSRR
ncbi:MAG: cation:proton antiporter [Armatimonadota bacterium]|nr:cation:proton antiporter [bacterium]